MEPSTATSLEVETTTPTKRSCINCVNCNCGSTEVTVVQVPICAEEGCNNLACSSSDDGNTTDRYQSSDAPVSDSEASEELKARIEAKLIAKDPMNPLRATICTDTDRDGNERKKLVWGSLHQFPEEIYSKWLRIKQRKAKRDGYLGYLLGSHMAYLADCYEEEKTDGKSRFLHVNTGTHGSKTGETIHPVVALVPAKLQKYMDTSVGFIKEDITALEHRLRTSVFLVNSRCVPLYPEGKDTCDAWCMSRLLQPERMELYEEQKEIARELRKE